MFNVVKPSYGKGGDGKYKVVYSPSLAARVRPRGIHRLARPNKLDVRRMPKVLREGYRKTLIADGMSSTETEAAVDADNVLNSVSEAYTYLDPKDFTTDYPPNGGFYQRRLTTLSHIDDFTKHISLRESVLIAQQARQHLPVNHGEKGAHYLDREFYRDVPVIGHLSAKYWKRSNVEEKEKFKLTLKSWTDEWIALQKVVEERRKKMAEADQRIGDCMLEMLEDEVEGHNFAGLERVILELQERIEGWEVEQARDEARV